MNPSSRAISVLSGVLIVLLMAGAGDVRAQQYRWLDEKGRVQYTDTPPPAGAKGVQKKNLGGGSVSEGGNEPYELQRARKAAPVKLYTAPGCDACNDARKFLNARGIPFTEISVVEDAERDELRAITGRLQVPVLLVGSSSMQRTFDDLSYDRALDAAGYPKLGNLAPRSQVAPVAKKAPATQPPPPTPEGPR